MCLLNLDLDYQCIKISFLKKIFSNGRCDPCQPGFGSVLLKALLDNMSFLPAAATGGM